MKTKAFTLLELVIVVIIIGVLATLALAGMFDVIERSRIAEAMAMAQTIRSAMERYALMNNGSYQGIFIGYDGGDFCYDDWSALGIGNPSCAPNSHFNYQVSGQGLPSTGYPGFSIWCIRNNRNRPPSMIEYSSIIISYPKSEFATWYGTYFNIGGIKTCGQGYYKNIYGKCPW